MHGTLTTTFSLTAPSRRHLRSGEGAQEYPRTGDTMTSGAEGGREIDAAREIRRPKREMRARGRTGLRGGAGPAGPTDSVL